MSPRSGRRFRSVAGLARHFLFGRVRRFAVQTEDYAAELRSLGVPAERVRVTGSVKYDGVLGDRQHPRTRDLHCLLGLRPGERVWLAGSTHAPEERIVLAVFRRLRIRHPNLRLILAPRSPDRFDEVAALLSRQSFSFVRRSAIDASLVDQPAVILLDSIGELGAAWGLADVGFVGGSFDGRRGGQSMIEPAGFGVPATFGPHIWNFRDAATRLVEVNGAVCVESEPALLAALSRLLDDAGLRERMGAAARALVLRQQGATDRTLAVLDEVLVERDAARAA